MVLSELIRLGAINAAMFNQHKEEIAPVLGSTPRMVYELYNTLRKNPTSGLPPNVSPSKPAGVKKRKTACAPATPRKKQAVQKKLKSASPMLKEEFDSSSEADYDAMDGEPKVKAKNDQPESKDGKEGKEDKAMEDVADGE